MGLWLSAATPPFAEQKSSVYPAAVPLEQPGYSNQEILKAEN